MFIFRDTFTTSEFFYTFFINAIYYYVDIIMTS